MRELTYIHSRKNVWISKYQSMLYFLLIHRKQSDHWQLNNILTFPLFSCSQQTQMDFLNKHGMMECYCDRKKCLLCIKRCYLSVMIHSCTIFPYKCTKFSDVEIMFLFPVFMDFFVRFIWVWLFLQNGSQILSW